MITWVSPARRILASSSTSSPVCRTASPHRGAPRPHKVSWTAPLAALQPSDSLPHGCVVCIQLLPLSRRIREAVHPNFHHGAREGAAETWMQRPVRDAPPRCSLNCSGSLDPAVLKALGRWCVQIRGRGWLWSCWSQREFMCLTCLCY